MYTHGLMGKLSSDFGWSFDSQTSGQQYHTWVVVYGKIKVPYMQYKQTILWPRRRKICFHILTFLVTCDRKEKKCLFFSLNCYLFNLFNSFMNSFPLQWALSFTWSLNEMLCNDLIFIKIYFYLMTIKKVWWRKHIRTLKLCFNK